jgi:hypothetical protein
MRAICSRFLWLLRVWLLVQLVGVGTPVALAATHGLLADSELCDCPGTDHGATCPMHHPMSARPATQGQCVVRGTHVTLDAALLAMAGGVGVLPIRIQLHTPVAPFDFVAPSGAALPFQSDLPDAPPPRA